MDTKMLVKIGGSEWEKAGKHRIYFNNLHEWYGLRLVRYNTGNISDAWLDGERISNSDARHFEGRLADARVYYDLEDGQFHGRGIAQRDLDRIVAEIKCRYEAAQNLVQPEGVDEAVKQTSRPTPRYYCEECGNTMTQRYCNLCGETEMIVANEVA